VASSPKNAITPLNGPLLSKTAGQLLEDFGAGAPTPGSGSAAAFMGILAAKLVETVCKKTIEKRTIAEKPDSQLQYLMDRAQLISIRLSAKMEQDSSDFDRVIELRRARDRAKDRTEESKLSRQSNEILEDSTKLIFDISEDCLELVDLGKNVFDGGWPAIRGDAGAALSAALAGAMSCAFIANLNAKTLRKRQSAKKIATDCRKLSERILQKQSLVMACMSSLNSEALTAIEVLIAESPVK